MAPDTDRRSLRSLRSDRDDSKERGVGVYTFVSSRGHLYLFFPIISSNLFTTNTCSTSFNPLISRRCSSRFHSNKFFLGIICALFVGSRSKKALPSGGRTAVPPPGDLGSWKTIVQEPGLLRIGLGIYFRSRLQEAHG
jgi:hypothetical protein